jgi:hypothetical protein
MLARYSKRVAKSAQRTVWNAVKSKVVERKEHIPPFALLVGLTALCFQIAVLYPWHHELSEQFEEVQVESLLILNLL